MTFNFLVKNMIFISGTHISIKFYLILCLVYSLITTSIAQENTHYCKEEIRLKKAGLTDIQEMDSKILVDLKYSTTDNFVGKDVYGCITHCFLQKITATHLIEANTFLKAKNPDLRLLIYDGVRSKRAQQILWDVLQKPLSEKHKYVANPQKGSIHNFGCAVDLTIADKNGIPLDMGTPFDYFGELAYPIKEKEFLTEGKLNQKQINNRKLLREVMQKAGFEPIKYEWWHFNYMTLEKAKVNFKIVE